MTNNSAVGVIADDDDLFVEDGWGDDDVDLGDEGEVDEQQQPPPPPAAKATNHNVADDEAGWDDDDDLDFDDDNDIDDKPTDGLEQRHDGTTGATKSQQQQQKQQPQPQKYCTTRTPPPPQEQQQQLYKDLEAYLKLLPHLQTSVNAIFDAEYNVSPQQALDVLQYYQERPGLLDYTLEKELPRMDYTIILRNTNNNTHEDPDHHHHLPQQKTVLQNKTPETSRAVADCLRRHGMNNTSGSSMQHVLPRAANQSLLADLLQVLTGPDRVIRPQYMATAVATSCHFVVDLGSSGQHDHHHHHHYDNDESLHYLQPPPSVRVTAELSLFLPFISNSNNGGRWKVADMTVVAQLILPSHSSSDEQEPPPVIDYRLASIRPIQHDNDETSTWQENLASVVALLTELDMDHGMDHHPDMMMEDTSPQPSPSSFSNNNNRHLHYRDAFLQQSQSFWDNSTAVAVGMKSVLQDIDAVSGLSQKWAALPQLLPSTDLLLEQEAQAAAEHHWRQQQQQQRPPTFHPQHHPMHRGPPPQQQQQQQRPQSILGGMLGKLAKAVALPEEDPDMYRDWQTPVTQQQQQQQQQRQQKQQQRPSVPPAAAAAAPSSGPQLYHRERPPPPPPLPSVPAPGRIPPPMGPSWSPMPLHDKPVHSPLPADRRNPPPPPTTPPRAAAALAQPKLSTSPLAARPPVQDEIMKIIDGWDDDDDALESENGDNDEHVNAAVSSDLDHEITANVRPALPAAYAKTHGQQQLVDSNRHSIVDKHTNTPSRKMAPSPPPLQPAGPAPVHDNGGIVYEEEEDPEWVYNAEDDCLPTRKRWRNPRPGPRQLASFSF